MGDGGARLLAKALQINTRLRTVHLDRNNISLQGFQVTPAVFCLAVWLPYPVLGHHLRAAVQLNHETHPLPHLRPAAGHEDQPGAGGRHHTPDAGALLCCNETVL